MLASFLLKSILCPLRLIYSSACSANWISELNSENRSRVSTVESETWTSSGKKASMGPVSLVLSSSKSPKISAKISSPEVKLSTRASATASSSDSWSNRPVNSEGSPIFFCACSSFWISTSLVRLSPRTFSFSLVVTKYRISGCWVCPYRSIRPFRCWNTISDQGISKWIILWLR